MTDLRLSDLATLCPDCGGRGHPYDDDDVDCPPCAGDGYTLTPLGSTLHEFVWLVTRGGPGAMVDALAALESVEAGGGA